MDVGKRARAWSHGRHDRICDIRIPWAHGTIVRASAHPEYYDFNLVRVEEAPALEVDELLAVADEALEGLAHRRLDFEEAEAGRAVAPALARHGWTTTGLVLLRHATGVAPGPAAPVEEVDWWDVRELRSAWHQEDFPGQPHDAYLEQSREVARELGVRTFASRREGRMAGFADLEVRDRAAEVTSVFVGPEHRGTGLGTSLTCAAITAAGNRPICGSRRMKPAARGRSTGGWASRTPRGWCRALGGRRLGDDRRRLPASFAE
jgi:ribosomal protein S18 acetylase RimI-like enzyme